MKKRNIKISPSILAADFSKLGEEIVKIDHGGADLVHIDVMDGHFVPNISIGPPVVKALRKTTKLEFDVHLMISDPDKYIDAFADAGADIITVHAEVCNHLNRTIQSIKSKGIKAGVALNPSTSINALDWVLNDIEMILIMTVNPGFGGQVFIDGMTNKVQMLKKMLSDRGLEKDIEVDGGIDLTNIFKITEAGANVIVAGSTVYKAQDTSLIIKQLKEGACHNG